MNLYFVNGNRQGEYHKLVPPGICIGREADNDIQLLLPGISRYHAKIEYVQGNQWKLSDLGSTNGTRIDGQKIGEPVMLEVGMKIIIGEQVMKITDDSVKKMENQTAVEQAPNIDNLHAAPENVTMKIQPSTQGVEELKAAALKISGSIFGKSSEPKESHFSVEPDSGRNKKRISNLLFLLLVVVLACIAVVIFAVINVPQQAALNEEHRTAKRTNPLLIEYEKKISSNDNIFRFYVRIENNSAVFKLDDLVHHRSFAKGIGSIEPEILRSLTTEVKNTDFMKIQSDPPGKSQNNTDEFRKLTVGYDHYLNTVVVRNNYPKLSFEAIEQALEQFASDYGLKTISLSVEEMRKEAESSFTKAEELLANYQAQPENLRNAILRYQITIDYLDQFDPKPEIWAISKKKLAYAKSLLQQLKKDAEFQLNVLYKRKQYAEAIAECDRLMKILDPEDKAYQKLRNLKISLEKHLSLQKKRRK